MPANGKLSDFARLVGQPTAEGSRNADQRVAQTGRGSATSCRPKTRKQTSLLAAVDAISQTMRSIFIIPIFRPGIRLEKPGFLVRRLESGPACGLFCMTFRPKSSPQTWRAPRIAGDGTLLIAVEQPARHANKARFRRSSRLRLWNRRRLTPNCWDACADCRGRPGRALAAIGLDVLKKLKPEELPADGRELGR